MNTDDDTRDREAVPGIGEMQRRRHHEAHHYSVGTRFSQIQAKRYGTIGPSLATSPKNENSAAISQSGTRAMGRRKRTSFQVR